MFFWGIHAISIQRQATSKNQLWEENIQRQQYQKESLNWVGVVQDSSWPHYHLEEFPKFSLCGLSVTLSNIEPIRCPSDHFQIPSYSFLDFHIRSRWILDAVSLLSPMIPLCKLEKGTALRCNTVPQGIIWGVEGGLNFEHAYIGLTFLQKPQCWLWYGLIS